MDRDAPTAFLPVSPQVSFADKEQETLKAWDEAKIFEKTITARQAKQRAAWQAKTEAIKARHDQDLALFLEKNGASGFSMGQ